MSPGGYCIGPGRWAFDSTFIHYEKKKTSHLCFLIYPPHLSLALLMSFFCFLQNHKEVVIKLWLSKSLGRAVKSDFYWKYRKPERKVPLSSPALGVCRWYFHLLPWYMNVKTWGYSNCCRTCLSPSCHWWCRFLNLLHPHCKENFFSARECYKILVLWFI